MTWQNPWGWLGLLTLVLPVLIHLLGRGRSRVERFPTLRFVETSRLLPTRRTRLHDLLLLAVRLAILAAAAAALAQPLLHTARRRVAANAVLSRAIVVDTSASMHRTTATGESAMVAAQREAARLAAEAGNAVILEVAAPAAAIPGAMSWLEQQEGRGEVVVLSDFQRGALDSAASVRVPGDLGLRLMRIAPADTEPIAIRYHRGAVDVVARIVADTASTAVSWSPVPATTGTVAVDLLAGPGEREAVDAATSAARGLGGPGALDSSRHVAIIYPGYPDHDALRQRAQALHSPWMTDFVARLRVDQLLVAATNSMTSDSVAPGLGGVTVARSGTRGPAVVAAQENSRLLLFVGDSPGSPLSAALIAATARALSMEPARAELERQTLTDATLSRWQRQIPERAPARTGPEATSGASDARWLWLLALILLGAEALLRRMPRTHEATGDVIG
jgi:hypothetical protein